MAPNNINLWSVVQMLKESGITNPADRRALIVGRTLRDKITNVLEINPEIQEDVAHSLGIGDEIIENLHEVMEKDFQEPETLLHELIEFFKVHGNLSLDIYDISEKSIRSFHTWDKNERILDRNSLFSSAKENSFVNEKNLLDSLEEDSSHPIEGVGGSICFKFKTGKGKTIMLSFWNKDTPSGKIAKIQKLFKKTGLLNRIKEKINHIESDSTDALTGLYNQRYIQNAVRRNMPYSAIFIDIDKFKKYNDTYGHSMWDTRLREVAEILQSSVRYKDKVCRNGWDEFVIFIDGCDAEEEISKIKKRIQEKIDSFNEKKKEIHKNADEEFPVISITGGHEIWNAGRTLKDIIDKADKDMLERKWDEGTIYRLIQKIDKLPLNQKRTIISWIIAMDPDLNSFMADEIINLPIDQQIAIISSIVAKNPGIIDSFL